MAAAVLPTREFHLVVFGATGFTGKQAVYLTAIEEFDHTPANHFKSVVAAAIDAHVRRGWHVRWALAGRSSARLSELCARLHLKPHGILEADVKDNAALRGMAERCALLLNCTGPYRFLGEPVVAAAVGASTDYIDLCGEPEFIERMALRYGDAARAAGVRVVHACAFDSVPADIGAIFTAMQFTPPSRCAHVNMYHTVKVAEGASGAYAHATTFEAAVHGFAGVGEAREQRKQLLDRMEARAPGSSKGAPPIGPRLRARPGPFFHPRLQKWAFLFPGADAAVVRATQRALAASGANAVSDAAPGDATAAPPITASGGAAQLSPQFAAYVCVNTTSAMVVMAIFGTLFNFLARRDWGRKLLLAHPKLFSWGAFSRKGPSKQMLDGTSFCSWFEGCGYSNPEEASPTKPFDKFVTCTVSGPEPGYVATPLLFLAVAQTLLDETAPELRRAGGVFTPGGLIGSAGRDSILRFVERCCVLGVDFRVAAVADGAFPKLHAKL